MPVDEFHPEDIKAAVRKRYNPGKVAVDLHSARVAASKWVSAPPPLAAAASAESVKYMLPALTNSFGEWVSGVTSSGKPIGDRRVVGALSQQVLGFLDAKAMPRPSLRARRSSFRVLVARHCRYPDDAPHHLVTAYGQWRGGHWHLALDDRRPVASQPRSQSGGGQSVHHPGQ